MKTETAENIGTVHTHTHTTCFTKQLDKENKSRNAFISDEKKTS